MTRVIGVEQRPEVVTRTAKRGSYHTRISDNNVEGFAQVIAPSESKTLALLHASGPNVQIDSDAPG